MFVPPVRKEQRREGNGRQQHSKRHYHPGVWVRRRFHGATLRSRSKSGQMETALARAHLDTATGPRLCPKDQPQHARVLKGGETIPTRTPPAEPLRLVMVSETAVDWRYHGRAMNRIAHRVLREPKCNHTAFRRAPVSAPPCRRNLTFMAELTMPPNFAGAAPN